MLLAEDRGRAVLSSRQQARIVLEAHLELPSPPQRQRAPAHHQGRGKQMAHSHLWEELPRKSTCCRAACAESTGGLSLPAGEGAGGRWRLAGGGEARVATDLIHGVKKSAPLWCEIDHCGHNDVLYVRSLPGCREILQAAKRAYGCFNRRSRGTQLTDDARA